MTVKLQTGGGFEVVADAIVLVGAVGGIDAAVGFDDFSLGVVAQSMEPEAAKAVPAVLNPVR